MITLAVLALVAFAMALTYVQRLELGGRTVEITIGAFAGGLLVLSALAPRGYSVEGKSLKVHTVALTLSYDLERLTNVQPVDPEDVFPAGTLRIFAVGGLFGSYGFFKTPNRGVVRAFVTNRSNLVLLEFGERVLVLSPDSPSEFVRTLHVPTSKS
jgi:hypothetical protein